jgi:phage terminase large subunit
VTLAPTRTVHFSGEGTAIFRWIEGVEEPPKEAMFEGVAGCGKTRLILQAIKAICNKYPQSKGLILRKTRVSLSDSVLPIWEDEVLGAEHPAVLNGPGRRNRAEYVHPRLGGGVMLGGMDNPTRLFSTQYDWIYVNEMQEFSLEEWESLHRALRRGAASGWQTMPFNLLVGDCNPDTEYHWANQRAKTPKLRRLVGRFWDNPMFFDHAENEWTPEGVDYCERLGHNLTGIRRRRLYKGEWVAAEGAVWEGFDAQVHVITGAVGRNPEGDYQVLPQGWKAPDGSQQVVPLKWFFGAMDWGFSEPSCAQVWGVDHEGRMWMVAEIYRTGWNQEEWAEAWTKLDDDFPLQTVVVDHEPALIDNMNKRIGPRRGRDMKEIVRECNKQRSPGAEKVGIDQVRVRLAARPDGTRGIYFLRDTLRHGEDPVLVEKAAPVCTTQEIPAYVYRLKEDGKPYKEEPDPTCVDHGCDTLRYACDFATWRNLTPEKEKRALAPDTYGYQLGHDNVLGRSA